jgi:hypothetical protein
MAITDGTRCRWATDGLWPCGLGTPMSRTFTVRNQGNATLTLGAVTVPAGFTLTEV